MAASEEFKEFKDRSIIKTLSVVFISIVSLPLIIVLIMYFGNEGFKDNANKFLSGLPGKAGGYFQSIPTKEDRERLKTKIAGYYITLDESRIIDKLLIVRNEDKKLFNDLLVLMSKENTSKMKKVKESLLAPEFKRNPFKRILAEIDRENEEKIDSMQKYFTSLGLAEAIQEIERTHAANEITADELAVLFERLKPEQTAKYLFYLNPELERQIKFKFPKEILRDIEKELEKLENSRIKTLDLALIYENKPIEEAVAELGDSDKYNTEQLALIFKNLTLNRSSEILSNIEDSDFISALFNEIGNIEKLQRDEQNTSSIITKGITIYKEYYEKIDELAVIYQRTDIKELAGMIETMLNRNEVYQRHTLGESEEIVFTEEQLAIDVLNRLKTNTVAEILRDLGESNRILLSKKLLD